MTTIQIKVGDPGADYVYLTDAIKSWLLKNGVKFVVRYFVDPASTRINKDIKAEEIAWLTEHKIAIVPNFERHHNDGNGGAASAQRNASEFLAVCTKFGVPAEIPHVVSVDTDVYFANINASEAYVREMARLLGRPIGAYGDDDIAYRCADIIRLFWRANAKKWDGEPRPVTVHAQQGLPIYPPGVDFNVCLIPFTAWAPWVVPAPSPVPKPERITVTFDSRYFTLGARGNDVRAWQHILNRLTGANMPEDGIYGPRTKAEVENWQRFFSLTIDGELGPITQKSIIDIAFINGL